MTEEHTISSVGKIVKLAVREWPKKVALLTLRPLQIKLLFRILSSVTTKNTGPGEERHFVFEILYAL